MTPQVIGLRVAGTIFGLMCCVNLLRLVTQFRVVIGGHKIPIWPNIIGFVITGGLCLWLWTL